ncbi:MAG: hypothetical protein C0462_14575 [Alcanivorax sp.]|nr:hypothetical protein [Alcanivorax sp.]
MALDDKKQAEAITLHTPDGRCLLKLDAQSDSPIVQLACDQGALVMRAGQNQHITVGKHHQTHIGESQTSQVGQHSRTRTDNGVIHYQAATNATLRAAQNVKLDAGKNIEIHSGKHLQIRAEGNARIEAKRAIVARVGGGLHVQANGALSITGDGSGDLTVHQNGGGFSIKKDGTIRLFGNTVTLKGSQGVRFNGQMHYNLGQGVKADSPVPAAPKTLTPIPELDLPPPRQQIKTLTVLPLRHGVFTSSNEAAMQAVPELPAHLNAPFALSDAKNSINVLRAGYVYVLIEREGGCHWQSYRSRLDGQLVSLDTPAPPHLATASSRPAPTVTLHHPDKITNSWWLFTPDPLTPAKQDEYQANAQDYASRGLWQAFSPKAWLDGQRNLPDTLSARQCQKGVLEAQLDNDTLRFAAVQQPFTDAWLGASPLALMPGNHAGSAFTQQLSRLEVDRGAALVLHDAIGMAQSLNAWRNGALDTLEAWQDSTDDQGVSNDWKWQVKQQIDQLHQHYAGQRAAGFMHRETRTQGTLAHSRLANLNYEEQQKRAVYGDDTFEELFGEDFRQRRDAIRREEEGLLAHEATRQHSPQQQAAYREEFERNYLSRLDTDSMQQLQVQFDEHSRAAEKDMERRATEQLRVLQSEALQHALHAYDKDDPASGVRFAAQTGLCTYGLTGCLSGRQLLHDWYGARTLTPENLALRSYAFNQREAETLVQDILADPPEADDARVDTQAAVAGPIKALLTYFERIDAAAAALEGQAALGLALSWQVSLGQSLLRANSPNALDRTVARGLAALMRSSIGKEALHLRLDELARKTGKATPYLPQHSRQAIQRSVSSNVNEAMLRQMAESQHSNFYQTRVYGGLLFLEALAFFMKARQEGPDSAPWYDLTAAALAASAAGTRLLGAGAELAATSFSEAAVSARAGQVIHGGLRLASGTLAATAGGVWVGMDLAEGLKAEGKNESVLSRAYYARSIAGAALIVGEGGMAMAASQPFWRAMTNRAERHGLGKAIVGIAQGGSSLAGRLASQKAMAALGKLVRLGGTTVLGATIAIEVLRPDQLEQWCSRSVFRAENGRGYDSAEDEITELLIAIEMVTH